MSTEAIRAVRMRPAADRPLHGGFGGGERDRVLLHRLTDRAIKSGNPYVHVEWSYATGFLKEMEFALDGNTLKQRQNRFNGI
jgi:hypothetical protein